MKRLVALVFAVATSTFAAETPTVGDLETGGRRLSREEVQSLVKGAAVTLVVRNGSERTWVNGDDGNIHGFVNDRAGQIGPKRAGGGTGKYAVDEDGRYCTEVTGTGKRRITTKSCRFIYEKDGQHWGIAKGKLDDEEAPAMRYVFEKKSP